MTYTELETTGIIRAAGAEAVRLLGTGDPKRDYSTHLAGHAAVEYMLRGSVAHTLDMSAPCPYCGQLPPAGRAA